MGIEEILTMCLAKRNFYSILISPEEDYSFDVLYCLPSRVVCLNWYSWIKLVQYY